MNIVDDSLYEEEEQFVVLLLPYYGGRVEENHARSIVLIQEDLSDGKMLFTYSPRNLIFRRYKCTTCYSLFCFGYTEVYPGHSQISKTVSFATLVNGLCHYLLLQSSRF